MITVTQAANDSLYMTTFILVAAGESTHNITFAAIVEDDDGEEKNRSSYAITPETAKSMAALLEGGEGEYLQEETEFFEPTQVCVRPALSDYDVTQLILSSPRFFDGWGMEPEVAEKLARALREVASEATA